MSAMPCQAPFCILFSSQKQREAPLYSPRLRIHLPIVKIRTSCLPRKMINGVYWHSSRV
ncbi:hypothetical protein Peur_025398 [Populus x canadensis]